MRKLSKIFLLAAILTAALCATALAADNDTSGVYDVETAAGYTLTPETANGDNITATAATINSASKTFYANAERFTLTGPISDAGNQDLVFALKNDTAALGSNTAVPTETNIVYIDQRTADGKAVTFSIYPSALESGVTYGIYVVGTNTSYTKVASFSYYAPYVLGDVDNNGTINTLDALQVLQYSAGIIQLSDTQILSADVAQPKGTINTLDALQILQYSANLINNFD